MKKLLVFQETNLYCEPRIRGSFLTPQLAYDYITDYLNYLETDAKEVLGGKWSCYVLILLEGNYPKS